MSLVAVVIAAALSASPAPSLSLSSPRIADPAVARGRGVFVRSECVRCHDVPPTVRPPPLAPMQQCAACHQRAARGDEPGPEALQTRWRTSVEHYLDVPPLDGLVPHLRRAWLAEFFLRPHDVRPGLEETMPRLPLTPRDADDLAAFLTRGQQLAAHTWSADADLDVGRTVFAERGCGGCHTFSGAAATTGRGIGRAPDLRHTRGRLDASTVLRWLEQPAAMLPSTSMPTPNLTPAERESVARFLLEAPLAPSTKAAAPPLLPTLSRPVRFAEVEPLLQPCAHCHDDAVIAGGEGGPGNTGGMGFAASGLDLSNYSAILRARFRGVSVTASRGHDLPLLVRALQQRHEEAVAEEAGVDVDAVVDDEVRGMPLGLPPLSPAEIQLVRSWIEQGMAR
jgi:cytochrome c2